MGGTAEARAVDGDVVTLNVGGTLVCTQRRTLTAARDSLLGAMFSGRWEESLVRDAAGHAFLDDDPVVFASLREHVPPSLTACAAARGSRRNTLLT